jgi:hypothetical protein
MVACLGAACAAPLQGAPHHHPAEIYEQLSARDRGFSTLPRVTPLGRPWVVVAEAWTDRVLAPTGVYLDDHNRQGVVAETYLTPHLADHLYLRGVEQLRAAGAVVRRSYGPYRGPAAPELRVLQVEIAHAELHRWSRKSLFEREAGAVDLVRVDYRFRWADGAGRETNAGAGRVELLLPPAGDDLESIAQTLVSAVLAELR